MAVGAGGAGWGHGLGGDRGLGVSMSAAGRGLNDRGCMVDQTGGGEMFKGLFYDFESEEQFVALVEKVRGKCEADGNCSLWSGSVTAKGHPVSYQNRGASYSLRKLVFQATNPNHVIPLCPFKLVCSCGNDRCLNPEHMIVKERESWDVVKIRERLDTNCICVPAEDGFDMGCKLWNGSLFEGYGMTSIACKSRFVHVLAMLLEGGIQTPPTDAKGNTLMVRHICKNKNCFEVSHLEWGTAKQNGEDRIRDGTNLAGEDHPGAKISNEVALAIKMSWVPIGDPDYMTQRPRAEKFGVHLCIVRDIDGGRTWSHLPGPANKPQREKATPQNKSDRNNLSDDDMSTLISRIADKVTITPGLSKDPKVTSPCHMFTGSTTNNGYGKMRYKHTGFHPHIIVCEHKMNRRTPDGLIVRHTCGNKLCVSPCHLEFGTKKENRLDSIIHGDIKHKFTIEDIKRIRCIPITDRVAVQEVADAFDVRIDYIQSIINKKIWLFVE
jgi:hypothetical protein